LTAKREPRNDMPRRLRLCIAAATALLASAAPADPPGARISGLTDVAFGTISNFAADSIRSQSVCVFAKGLDDGYSITASGSGSSGAFQLASGSYTLPYEVQWSGTTGQTSGSQLLANQPLAGFHTGGGPGAKDDCSKGPSTTASLIVILRSPALGAATSGTYGGTLTLLVAPN
jgi:hypothetical protein